MGERLAIKVAAQGEADNSQDKENSGDGVGGEFVPFRHGDGALVLAGNGDAAGVAGQGQEDEDLAPELGEGGPAGEI